jgi:hypothetical protein
LQQAVEDGGGNDAIAEDLAPGAEALKLWLLVSSIGSRS